MEEIMEKLLAYVTKSTNSKEIYSTDNIFEKGLVHSLFAMQLILYIEKEFDIELEDEELDFEKIKSVKDIAELVYSKM
ncbi:acyl carrier protein [Ruminiclostridium sufflavum DSM 19573]|uniref:Acyl carrier protein n=1 Tax=Ruminiclostridium sufflavum DSM 19573 TaxID=1121337 RepID=A0A318XST5_9FIRM|nr:phosphopantetheine-binding protein [Ruminiclostridium sufflavum]PYG84944.1 acyl carrier protein [Ruminiclostridium sufflavum DSM 19573]